jgi:hypothetical protein
MGGLEKVGDMRKMWARAELRTDHYAPIIISDLSSAVVLLDLFPDMFVAYIDGESYNFQYLDYVVKFEADVLYVYTMMSRADCRCGARQGEQQGD